MSIELHPWLPWIPFKYPEGTNWQSAMQRFFRHEHELAFHMIFFRNKRVSAQWLAAMLPEPRFLSASKIKDPRDQHRGSISGSLSISAASSALSLVGITLTPLAPSFLPRFSRTHTGISLADKIGIKLCKADDKIRLRVENG